MQTKQAKPAVSCPRCESRSFTTTPATFKDGSQHLRRTCAQCGAFVDWAPQGEDLSAGPPSGPRPAAPPVRGIGQVPPSPPGPLVCPRCRQSSFLLGQGRLTCARCNAPVAEVPAEARQVPSEWTTDPPPESWPWLAMVQQADGRWYPIALAPTNGEAWEAALSCWMEGPLLLMPVRPPVKGRNGT